MYRGSMKLLLSLWGALPRKPPGVHEEVCVLQTAKAGGTVIASRADLDNETLRQAQNMQA